MSHGHNATAASNSAIRYFYLASVFFLTLTGFGQLPIFKRYYILAGILFSGIFLVIRNLSGSNFSSAFIILLDPGHLGCVMAFLLLSIYCLIFRKKWTTPN